MKWVERFLLKRPILIAVFVSIILLGIYSVVESQRANTFQRKLENYQQVQLTPLINTSDEFLSDLDTAHLCNLSAKSLIKNKQTYRSKDLLLRYQAEVLSGEPPVFSSEAMFFPNVLNARQVSGRAERIYGDIVILSNSTPKLEYCFMLAESFSSMQFLGELSTPEGVNALMPSQLRTFAMRLDDARDKLATIDRVPVDFANEHEVLQDELLHLAKLLRQSDANVDLFSANIESGLNALDETLSIMSEHAQKTNALPNRFSELLLQMQSL